MSLSQAKHSSTKNGVAFRPEIYLIAVGDMVYLNVLGQHFLVLGS